MTFMDMESFRTHTGEVVTGERLKKAFQVVADFYENNARGIRKENAYAAHVSEETKEANLKQGLRFAQDLRNGIGVPYSFALWQRINAELTGECVALFSK